jgi:hypothetical protein
VCVCVAVLLLFLFFLLLFFFFFSFSSLLAAIGWPPNVFARTLSLPPSLFFLFSCLLFPPVPRSLNLPSRSTDRFPTVSNLYSTHCCRAQKTKPTKTTQSSPTRLHSALGMPRATGRCHAVPKLFARHRTSPHCTAPHFISFHRPARPLPLLSVFFRPSAWPLLHLRSHPPRSRSFAKRHSIVCAPGLH